MDEGDCFTLLAVLMGLYGRTLFLYWWAHDMMLKGTELILVPNACPMKINRLVHLWVRVYENMAAIAPGNYFEGVADCNGGSSVFDSVAYLPNEDGSQDFYILQAEGKRRDLHGYTGFIFDLS